MKKYYIKTYGCQMNAADSAKLADVLAAAGYQRTADSQYRSADIILVNTCVVRQHAEDRAAWFVTSLKNLKLQNPNLKIVLCGCLVTEPGRDVKKMFPHVDLFLPPNSPELLAQYLSPVASCWSPVMETRDRRQETRFITVMHGCNNFCSYCIVPYVRGREISRPIPEVLQEVGQLVGQGAKEIMLLGQNVNSYEFGLANLLKQIQQFVVGHSSFVISFMTSHPRDMSEEIIQAVKELPYVAKDFHLPLQSGDDKILEKMNRGYTTDYFRQLVKKIREQIPRARISTEVIVGFPGETEAQFQRTLDFVKEMKFTHVNMFAYSARPGTAAEKLPDQLPEKIKEIRLKKLIHLVRSMLSMV